MTSQFPHFGNVPRDMKVVAKSLHFKRDATMEIFSPGKDSSRNRCIVACPTHYFFFYFLDMISNYSSLRFRSKMEG
jgi:hypothetical protein